MTAPTSRTLRSLLQDRFGHADFRPGQEGIVQKLLEGRDVVAVLPTGAGKSLPFQLAAQVLEGPTLVVSPLVALMKDQADSLQAQGVEAGVINSAIPASESREGLEKAQAGEAKLLYVTPERFENPAFLDEARAMGVSLLVVDEAHCVSDWGFDFRPAYLALRSAAEAIGRPPVLALTATATPWVRADIIERLGLRDPEVVVHGVDRPNLFLEARSVLEESADRRILQALFSGEEEDDYPEPLRVELRAAMRGAGIIYTATVRAAEETAGWLREWGVAADFYHGRRRKADRDRVQDAFMSGELQVVAATNAFGLGIDKPDVRFVIHRDVPPSLEEYYQEAGRAGRDGELARCLLIFRPGDLGRAAFRSGTSKLTAAEVRRVLAALPPDRQVAVPELAREASISRPKLRRALDLLQRAGAVEQDPVAVRLTYPGFDPRSLELDREDARREYEQSRLQMMRAYAELRECRRAFVLNYFGQQTTARCGFCDNDLRGASEEREADSFSPGARVRHAELGTGTVAGSEGDLLTVRFRSGERKLSRAAVEEAGLLEVLSPGAPEPEPDPDGLELGRRVVHPQYGPGEVQRVAEESVTVLFERAGYHTLDRAAVRERGLLALEEEE